MHIHRSVYVPMGIVVYWYSSNPCSKIVNAGLMRFSTTKNQWQQLDASTHTPLASGMTAVVGNDIYSFGAAGGPPNAELWRWSTMTQQSQLLDESQVSGSPPRARYGHTVAAVGSDIYVFGGENGANGGGLLGDLWLFSTTAKHWRQLGAYFMSGSPSTTILVSGRSGHGMVVVGGDLYVWGGRTTSTSTVGGVTNDVLVYATPRVHVVPAAESFSAAWFSRVYDGDIVQLTGDADWLFTVDLCFLSFPCSLIIAGDPAASSTIRRQANSRIVCDAALGCSGLTMRHITVACMSETSASGPLQISGAGAVATIEDVTFSDCSSVEDGGSIRAYNGAAVRIFGTTFQRSSTQVPILTCHS